MHAPSAKEVHEAAGSSGVFGEIFIGLGLLIGLVGTVFWTLTGLGFYDDSVVGKTAAHADWTALSFLFIVEGLGFVVFGVMCMVAGWDRHKHPDIVH